MRSYNSEAPVASSSNSVAILRFHRSQDVGGPKAVSECSRLQVCLVIACLDEPGQLCPCPGWLFPEIISEEVAYLFFKTELILLLVFCFTPPLAISITEWIVFVGLTCCYLSCPHVGLNGQAVCPH